jgi:hypothetical protein
MRIDKEMHIKEFLDSSYLFGHSLTDLIAEGLRKTMGVEWRDRLPELLEDLPVQVTTWKREDRIETIGLYSEASDV